MTQTTTYRAVAFNTIPTDSDGIDHIAEAVFDVPQLSLHSALELAGYWKLAGYCAFVYSYDQNDILLGVTYRGEAKPVAGKFKLPQLYVSTWRGTVDGSDVLSSGEHAAVFDVETQRIFALTGQANDPESIATACLFAAAPRLLNALESVMQSFAYKPGSPSEPVWYAKARMAIASVRGNVVE